MFRKTIVKILILAAFLVMVSANAAANVLPLNNKTTAYISDLYPNLFTPAGITFSIWGLIYILLLAFVVYQARDLFSSHKKAMPFLPRIGPLFVLSCLLNAAWIFAWHYLQVGLSMVIMILLLLSLVKIYLNLETGKIKVSTAEEILVRLPFRVYLGWITIATIANAAALLVDLGWGRFGLSEEFWTAVVIGAAAVITVSFLILRRDLAVAMVSLWALLGIVLQRMAVHPPVMPVVVSASAAMVIIAAFMVMVILQNRQDQRKPVRAE